MKTQAFAALFIAALSTSVFALPSDNQPVLGESKQGATLQVIDPIAAEGSFMILDRVAEGGAGDGIFRQSGGMVPHLMPCVGDRAPGRAMTSRPRRPPSATKCQSGGTIRNFLLRIPANQSALMPEAVI